MKWLSKDMDMYIGAKEYVDTVVLPLVPVSFGNDMKQVVSMYEFTMILTTQLEKQFKGRMVLLPHYTYINPSYDDELKQLKKWEEELLEEGFKHIFYMTADDKWEEWKKSLNGHLICFPSIPLNDMEEKYKQSIIEDQMKELITIFMQKWK